MLSPGSAPPVWGRGGPREKSDCSNRILASGTRGGHSRWLNLPLRDSWPCPFWLGLCSHGDAGLAAPSAGLGWGARCPLHWLPLTGSQPGTQEENLVEPRERSIPSGQGCQRGGSPRKWLAPAPEAQAGEGWGLWPPLSPGYSLRQQGVREQCPPPRVLPLSLGWARREACASELKVSQRARQALRMGGVEGSGENWADSHVH